MDILNDRLDEKVKRMQKHLKAFRQCLGISQNDFANKILRMSPATYAGLERGKTAMTYTQYYALRHIFDCEVAAAVMSKKALLSPFNNYNVNNTKVIKDMLGYLVDQDGHYCDKKELEYAVEHASLEYGELVMHDRRAPHYLNAELYSSIKREYYIRYVKERAVTT